jgi:hypothetical protein
MDALQAALERWFQERDRPMSGATVASRALAPNAARAVEAAAGEYRTVPVMPRAPKPTERG